MAQYREAECDAIRECLENYPPFLALGEVEQDALVKMLEIGCNNCTFDRSVERKLPQIWEDPRYLELYSNIGYNLKINLDPGSSVNDGTSYLAERVVGFMIGRWLEIVGSIWDPDIPWKLVTGYLPVIHPKMAAYLEGYEINPARSQKYLDEIQLREQQVIDKKFTTHYPCSRCGARKATYVIVQRRGLDEDNTLIITCMQCGHNWKKH